MTTTTSDTPSPVYIDRTLRLECDCHCSVLDLFCWHDEAGDIWLEYYVQDTARPWSQRLRDAWYLLHGGRWPAGMAWRRADAAQLHAWLSEVLAAHPAHRRC